MASTELRSSHFPTLDHVPDAVIVASPDNVIRYANPAVTRLLGWRPSELAGLPLITLIPQRLREAHEIGFARFVSSGRMRRAGVPLRVAASRHDGSEVEIDLMLGAVPGDEGQWAMGVLRDVGDQVALERELLVGTYLRASVEVSATLHKAHGTADAFAMLLPALCEHLDWELAAIWQPDLTRGRLTCVARWHDGAIPAAAIAMTEGIELGLGEGLPGQVWNSQQPVLLSTAESDFPRAAIAVRHGLANGLGFALLGVNGPLGIVEFWSAHMHEVDDDLRSVLLSIGRQLGLFLERVDAESALRHTLDVLQTSLLPAALPNVPRLRLGAHYQPAEGGVTVSGDFFDAFPLLDGRWAFVIADVCGKGAAAAAVTAMARYTIRTAALDHDDPGDVLRILNTAMLSDSIERPFLTACLVVIDTHDIDANGKGATAIVTAAGHPLPLRRAPDGPVSQVGRPGDLLGVMPSPQFEPTVVELAAGDVLLLYTDGFTEARDPEGSQLGEAGLARLLRESPTREPATVLAWLVAGLARHTGSRTTTDDAAALVIGVEPARAKADA